MSTSTHKYRKSDHRTGICGDLVCYHLDGEPILKKFVGKGSNFRFTPNQITRTSTLIHGAPDHAKEAHEYFANVPSGTHAVFYGFNEMINMAVVEGGFINIYAVRESGVDKQPYSTKKLPDNVNFVDIALCSLEDEYTSLMIQLEDDAGTFYKFEMAHTRELVPKKQLHSLSYSYLDGCRITVTMDKIGHVHVLREPHAYLDTELVSQSGVGPRATRWPNCFRIGGLFYLAGIYKTVKLGMVPEHVILTNNEFKVIHADGSKLTRFHISGVGSGHEEDTGFAEHSECISFPHQSRVLLHVNKLVIRVHMRGAAKLADIPADSVIVDGMFVYVGGANGEMYKIKTHPQGTMVYHLEKTTEKHEMSKSVLYTTEFQFTGHLEVDLA